MRAISYFDCVSEGGAKANSFEAILDGWCLILFAGRFAPPLVVSSEEGTGGRSHTHAPFFCVAVVELLVF